MIPDPKKQTEEAARPSLWQDYHKGMDVESIILSFKNHMKYTMAKDHYTSTSWDQFYSMSRALMDRLIERWIATQQTYYNTDAKRIYYLSLEFLIGRLLGNNLINLMIMDKARAALHRMSLDIEDIRRVEVDAGLGNGGLGRLAACFLDSMATLELPGYGYGIRYEFGIFRQIIRNGFQVEIPDEWLRFGNPWEIPRPESSFEVCFGGTVENRPTRTSTVNPVWVHANTVLGVPYDTPIAGYKNNTVNTLRLWSARSSEEFDLEIFNDGDYVAAVENKNLSEVISKVLYPNDNIFSGKELRFKQEYFFVSCSLQDIVRRFKKQHGNHFERFPSKVAVQLNDTHPALGIAELMRILIDTERVPYDKAWEITQETFAYTNHTLLPEALEKWPVPLFEKILPRHLQIIYEINRRFMRDVASRFLNDRNKLANLSLIEEGGEKQVRMAHLAVVGSHSVNGVAALHTELLKSHVLRDFYEYSPEKFNNKTNGITQRRWLLKANPGLASLISDHIGTSWTTNLDDLRKLEPFADNPDFQKAFFDVKRRNKEVLCKIIADETRISITPDAIFDIQVKRIHEYKRQLLFALGIIIQYMRLKKNPGIDLYPRVYICGGKSAPGYQMAKLIIKLINSIGEVVNVDPLVNGKIKVVFLPNYRVSTAEKIFPAADVSEQISTAGMEASGTGNMKFAMNGALTIGTLDGANIEIREEVGAENFFLFGKTVEELAEMRGRGYNPWDYYHANRDIREALDLLDSDFFCNGQARLFRPIYDSLLTWGDHYCHLADIEDYLAAQDRIDQTYRDQAKWARMAILNVARMGKFSSDRTIHQYAEEIWGAKRIPVTILNAD
ncbi:MAG: glycogen/starch/alpha-glucan phosphorylase [Spirochaetota bacterium]|jgi:starch phosphorylase|nr:glycogen/starch/alpha-glucan phosphorylase [Spirochaetota bacterium]